MLQRGMWQIAAQRVIFDENQKLVAVGLPSLTAMQRSGAGRFGRRQPALRK